MKLKLPVVPVVVLLMTSGCVVHFPLADNVPSLQSSSDSTPTGDMGLAPTEPNTRDPVKGNSADNPDQSHPD